MTFSPDRSLSEYSSLVGQARAVFMGSQNSIQTLERQLEKQAERFERDIAEATKEVSLMKEYFLRQCDEDRENCQPHDQNTMQDLKSRLTECRRSEAEWSRRRNGALSRSGSGVGRQVLGERRRELTRANSSLWELQIDQKTRSLEHQQNVLDESMMSSIHGNVHLILFFNF